MAVGFVDERAEASRLLEASRALGLDILRESVEGHIAAGEGFPPSCELVDEHASQRHAW